VELLFPVTFPRGEGDNMERLSQRPRPGGDSDLGEEPWPGTQGPTAASVQQSVGPSGKCMGHLTWPTEAVREGARRDSEEGREGK
jgi:hypothetical protein